jgi:hypothetical protein
MNLYSLPDKTSSGWASNAPVEIFTILIAAISSIQILLNKTSFEPTNSLIKIKNAYGIRVRPNMDMSYQNFIDGKNNILMQKDPPVQSTNALNTIKNEFIKRVFLADMNAIIRNE